MFLAENIRHIRKSKKMSQTAFSEELGLTRDTICSLELKRVSASLETVMKIRETFNVNLDDLIYKDLGKEEKR